MSKTNSDIATKKTLNQLQYALKISKTRNNNTSQILESFACNYQGSNVFQMSQGFSHRFWSRPKSFIIDFNLDLRDIHFIFKTYQLYTLRNAVSTRMDEKYYIY